MGAIALLVTVTAFAYAFNASNAFTTWGFDDTKAEQFRALERYHDAAGVDPTGIVVALIQTGGPVDTPAGRALAKRALRILEAEPDIERTVDPFAKRPAQGLTSNDGSAAAVVGYLRPDAINGEASNRLLREFAPMTSEGVTLGGEAIRRKVVSNTAEEDLKIAETIAFPLLFLVALLVFRGVVAALVPMIVGLVTIPVSLSLMRLVDQFSDVSVYALNLIMGLGLGLAIDYSLLMVTRFREELAAGSTRAAAIGAMVESAGRTVLFSSLTVAGAASSLMIFKQPYMYSMGIGGVTVALASAFVALFLLPAFLVVLGPRIDALSLTHGGRSQSFDHWLRIGRGVMRRPVAIAAGMTMLIVLLALPALHIRFSTTDGNTLPAGYGARNVQQTLDDAFDRSPLVAPVFVVIDAPRDQDDAVRAYARRVASNPAIKQLGSPVYVGNGAWRIDAFPNGTRFSGAAQRTVATMRDAANGLPVLVSGLSAWYVDQKALIRSQIPELLAIIAVITFFVLFMMTGSVVLPVKTFMLNLATIAAIFGVMVWIFQDGRLEQVLSYTSTGTIELTQPVIVFAIVFGLATDYGVFMLSRIKELHDAGYDNDDSVALGLAYTGGVITAAALLFCIAMFAFAISRIGFIKATGIGIGLAVAFDATFVRALLVPALMKLLGDYNWWAPAPLRALHNRWGWTDAPPQPGAASPAPPAPSHVN